MSHPAADSDDSQPTPAIPTTQDAAQRPHDQASAASSPKAAERIVSTALTRLTPTRPLRTYHKPRPTLWFVVRRTWARAISMQVWDVAATMTFYLFLSILPGLIAIASIVSVVNFTEETIWTVAGLVNDLFPAMDAAIVADTLLTLINTPGGVTALTLGLIGSLYSASNVVAAFHRAMNRIYDTREGRPFIYFRFIVFLETVVLIVASLALLVLIILGGDLSRRLGELLGLTQESVAAWNILKWPLILVVLIVLVSQA
ncbi:MAG TPA: YihY/virulence factor BrkB family protein, partial [Enteractinococcus helveticum]